eukprot:7260606-Pyramimonas_sp.AAC.1
MGVASTSAKHSGNSGWPIGGAAGAQSGKWVGYAANAGIKAAYPGNLPKDSRLGSTPMAVSSSSCQ